MANITLTISKIESIKADAILVPLLKTESQAVTSLAVPSLTNSFQAVKAKGTLGELTQVIAPNKYQTPVVYGLGLGESDLSELADHSGLEKIRQAFGSAIRALKGKEKVAVVFPAADENLFRAAFEGLAFGSYNYLAYKTKDSEEQKPVSEILFLVSDRKEQKALSASLAHSITLAEGVHTVRDLVNTPSNLLYPETFAHKAKELSASLPIKIEVLDENALAKGNYGGIIGVGQGSSRPPRLVKLHYKPRKAKEHVAIVGKGITFDTGGISLKPSEGMDAMTMDMAGAATALAAVITAAKLKLDIEVTSFLALAENMPGANAQRPGDVVVTRNGTTVEVLNTDAEGRMVMADALSDAAQLNPDLLLDVATLTGAAMVALGTRTAAVMGTDSARDEIFEAAKSAGELFWPMPLPEELKEHLKGRVADLKNIGDRWGGALSAGLFLQAFVGDTNWAHLDIAGPAFTSKAHGYTNVGGTGMGLRTIIEVLEKRAS